MNRLVVITGRPGAGKTTLAQRLGGDLGWPVISRDALWEAAFRRGEHDKLAVLQEFVEAIREGLEQGPVIAEAAFQARVWEPILAEFRGVRLVVLEVDPELAFARVMVRATPEWVEIYGPPARLEWEAPTATHGLVVMDADYDQVRAFATARM